MTTLLLSTDKGIELCIREMEPEDIPYVAKTTINHIIDTEHEGDGESIMEPARRLELYRNISKLINTQLLGGDCLVVCNPDVPDQLFGFAFRFDNALVMLHVKQNFRRVGIASLLLTVMWGDETNIPILHNGWGLAKLKQYRFSRV